MTMNKLGLTIIALCIGLLPAYAAGDGSTKAMRNLVVEGNRLYAEENYHGALEKGDEADFFQVKMDEALKRLLGEEDFVPFEERYEWIKRQMY